jgi:transcriptional regulator with XRE-family HTH domain
MDPLKREFIELFEASGWSQAELGRRIDMTRGGVNGIITGDAVPSMAAVRLFRLVLAQVNPKAASQVSYGKVAEPNHDVMSDDDVGKDDLEELLGMLDQVPKNRLKETIEALKRVTKLASKS